MAIDRGAASDTCRKGRTNGDGPTYVEGMTTSPFMPAARALSIMQEVASQAAYSDLLEVLTEVPIEDIREAFATACKYLFVQTLDLKGTEARSRREAKEHSDGD